MLRGQRNTLIDFWRGMLILLMALDHAREFFHYGRVSPTDLATTTPILFMTRFVTHFCAPGFVFLAGVSAFLFAQKHTIPELRKFLFVRGLLLVLLELVVVNFFWWFDPRFRIFNFQVIWITGWSMVLLSLLVGINKKVLLIMSVAIIAAHNLLDVFNTEGISPGAITWYFLHQMCDFTTDGYRWIFVTYPLVPWFAVLSLGFVMGGIFKIEAPNINYKPRLLIWGGAALLIFIVLRLINGYGDPSPWKFQNSTAFTLMSFMKVSKYPPSLDFLLVTLGFILIFLGVKQSHHNAFSRFVVVFGQVPLFFYLLHILVLHVLLVIFQVAEGAAEIFVVYTPELLYSGKLKTFGYSLATVYLVWIFLMIGTYPLCRLYNRLKGKYPESFLRYF